MSQSKKLQQRIAVIVPHNATLAETACHINLRMREKSGYSASVTIHANIISCMFWDVQHSEWSFTGCWVRSL